jgi:hypothetical protein
MRRKAQAGYKNEDLKKVRVFKNFFVAALRDDEVRTGQSCKVWASVDSSRGRTQEREVLITTNTVVIAVGIGVTIVTLVKLAVTEP